MSATFEILTASGRHPEVLRNTISAVSGYWTNSQFKEGENYANVTVSDNLNSNTDIRSFMDYLCTPDDNLRSASSMGSWSINKEVSQAKPNESPKTQPPTSPPPKPALTETKVKEESKSVAPRPSIKPQRRTRTRRTGFGRNFGNFSLLTGNIGPSRTSGGRSVIPGAGTELANQNENPLVGNRGRNFFSNINDLRNSIIL